MKDNDKLYKEIVSNIKELKDIVIKVGIQSDAGTNEHGDYIADYAYQNEFGVGTADFHPDKLRAAEARIKRKTGRDVTLVPPSNMKIPERSFLRSAFDENIEKLYSLVKNVYVKTLDNKIDIKQETHKIGKLLNDAVVRKINQIKDPPNSWFTILVKGSSKPLVDTGTMRKSIKYKVEYKK